MNSLYVSITGQYLCTGMMPVAEMRTSQDTGEPNFQESDGGLREGVGDLRPVKRTMPRTPLLGPHGPHTLPASRTTQMSVSSLST